MKVEEERLVLHAFVSGVRHQEVVEEAGAAALIYADINPDGALSPGIYCTVELFIPRKTPSMIISADAVVFDENGQHVAVVENGIVHFQKITVARDFGTEVEVHDGVKAGDQVILNPMVNLEEGSKVTVRKVEKT